jgi:uncharacterized RDD family membrane protein YckC
VRRATLTIRTPEGIVFSLPLAGPASRLLAWSVDATCIVAASALAGIALAPLSLVSRDLAMALNLMVFFALSIGYAAAAEWFWRGQTLGKRVLKLRVVDEAGLALQPSQVIVRNLLRAVDALPLFYLIGGAAVLLSRNGQRLGDYAAGTVVIHARRHTFPDLEPYLGGKFNSLREHPHLAARLAQRLSPEEAALGLRAVQRRNQLSPEARVAVFARLAEHYRARVQFPESTVEALADEQYVCNVVDIVYRPR